jgi:hypothetical protein
VPQAAEYSEQLADSKAELLEEEGGAQLVQQVEEQEQVDQG